MKVDEEISPLENYGDMELFDELAGRYFNFLSHVDDRDIEEEYNYRNLGKSSNVYNLETKIDILEDKIRDLTGIEDEILKLFYEYVRCGQSSEFDKELKTFFEKTINQRIF